MKNFFLVLITGIYIFLFSALLALPQYKQRDYDNQNLAVWADAGLHGLLPYRDFFYPYGLLPFYQTQSLFVHAIYWLLPLILFFTLYEFLLEKSKQVLASFFLTTLCMVSCSVIAPFDSVVRYGLPLFFILSQKWLKHSVIKGLVAGLIFAAFYDQGILCVLLFSAITITEFVFLRNTRKFFTNCLYFGLGFMAGTLPLVIYLFWTHSFSAFIQTFSQIADLTIIAKTPSLNAFKKIQTVLLVITGWGAVSWYCYQFKKNQQFLYNYSWLLQFSILLLVILYKSSIRLIDEYVIWYFFFYLTIILAVVWSRLRSHFYPQIWMYVYSFVVFFVVLLSITKTIVPPAVTTDYQQSFQEINKITQNQLIFSYPGDPIFYELNNQKPPHYLDIYSASSIPAQKELISYLKNNHIRFVIYNPKVTSIQDGVPDALRGRMLFSYILQHYQPVGYFHGFLVLQQSENADFFTSSVVADEDKQNLLNIDLGSLPITQEKDLRRLLTNHFTNATDRADQTEMITSDNLVLKIHCADSQKATITIRTAENIATKLMWQCRKNLDSLIALHHLPLFAKSRTIAAFELSANLKSLQLFQLDTAFADPRLL